VLDKLFVRGAVLFPFFPTNTRSKVINSKWLTILIMKFNNLEGIKQEQENGYEENRLLQIAKTFKKPSFLM
jgi:hypothetical protein